MQIVPPVVSPFLSSDIARRNERDLKIKNLGMFNLLALRQIKAKTFDLNMYKSLGKVLVLFKYK